MAALTILRVFTAWVALMVFVPQFGWRGLTGHARQERQVTDDFRLHRDFQSKAAMSPSTWWDNKLIVREVRVLKSKPAVRTWLDIGTAEGRRALTDVKELRDALVRKGWLLDDDLMYLEIVDGKHDDASFAGRAPLMLKYLFPPVRN